MRCRLGASNCHREQSSRYLIRDRDGAYGEIFIRRLQSTSPRSPWQNGYAERLIGSIRRECLDHVIVFSERHLRHLLLCYMKYYNGARTHLSLEKDAPVSRAVELAGHIAAQFSADYTTSMSGFDLRQAQAGRIWLFRGTLRRAIKGPAAYSADPSRTTGGNRGLISLLRIWG